MRKVMKLLGLRIARRALSNAAGSADLVLVGSRVAGRFLPVVCQHRNRVSFDAEIVAPLSLPRPCLVKLVRAPRPAARTLFEPCVYYSVGCQ